MAFEVERAKRAGEVLLDTRVRLLVMAAAALACGRAWAHYPHDVTKWAAISPDPDQLRIATALEPIDLDLIGRSENGLDWAARLIPSRDGFDAGAAFLTADRLVFIAGVGPLLVSEDAGDSFTDELTITDTALTGVVASPDVLGDGTAFVTGETAVWRTQDAGLSWDAVYEQEGGFEAVSVSPEFPVDGRVCATKGDTVACSADFGESWTVSRAPPDIERATVGAAGRVWAPVREVGLYLSEDDGANWELVGFAGEDVTTVSELSDDLVLITTGLVAGWRSEDAGRTWAPFDGQTVGVDQPADGVNFFDFVEGPDGAVYLTAWYGLAVSHDRGETFTFYNVEPIQNTHAVTLTRGENGALAAWVGTYGGGPVQVDIATLQSVVYTGMNDGFTRNAVVTRDFQAHGVAVQDMGYETWVTTDWGATWVSVANDYEDDGVDMSFDVKGVAVSPDPIEDPFLLAVVGEGAMEFWTSVDHGLTWAQGEQTPNCDDRGIRVAISPRWPEESRAWASCGGRVYETDDRGATWWVLGDTGTLFIFDMVEQNDGSLLVGTTDGLWRLTTSGAERFGFDGAFVVGLAASEEADVDTIFALAPTEGWMRSDDGGESWTTLPAPTADVPRRVSMSPTYGADGTVAVAGYGGAWVSEDRGETWRSIYAVEVYETDHDAWALTGDWEWESWEGASRGRVIQAELAGSQTTFQFHGIALEVQAPANDNAATVRVTLDDGAPEELVTPTDGSPVWSVEGLEDTWHTLRIEVVAGTVVLDAGRVTRIAASVGAVPPGEEVPGCAGGCGGGGAAGVVLLGGVLGWGRRRREGVSGRWWGGPFEAGIRLP